VIVGFFGVSSEHIIQREARRFVDTIDFLHRAYSPDASDVPDKKLGMEDKSSDGVASEELEEVGEKRKSKGKVKARKEGKERDGSSDGTYETF
jgi:hypothetical protein